MLNSSGRSAVGANDQNPATPSIASSRSTCSGDQRALSPGGSLCSITRYAPRFGRYGTTSAVTDALRGRVHLDRLAARHQPVGEPLGEAVDLDEVVAQGEEVVDGLGDGLAEEVVHHVVDRFEPLRLHRSERAALGRRHPTLAVQQARDLVLLGQVVEVVPAEVARVVAVGRARRQGEHPELDLHVRVDGGVAATSPAAASCACGACAATAG